MTQILTVLPGISLIYHTTKGLDDGKPLWMHLEDVIPSYEKNHFDISHVQYGK